MNDYFNAGLNTGFDGADISNSDAVTQGLIVQASEIDINEFSQREMQSQNTLLAGGPNPGYFALYPSSSLEKSMRGVQQGEVLLRRIAPDVNDRKYQSKQKRQRLIVPPSISGIYFSSLNGLYVNVDMAAETGALVAAYVAGGGDRVAEYERYLQLVVCERHFQFGGICSTRKDLDAKDVRGKIGGPTFSTQLGGIRTIPNTGDHFFNAQDILIWEFPENENRPYQWIKGTEPRKILPKIVPLLSVLKNKLKLRAYLDYYCKQNGVALGNLFAHDPALEGMAAYTIRGGQDLMTVCLVVEDMLRAIKRKIIGKAQRGCGPKITFDILMGCYTTS